MHKKPREVAVVVTCAMPGTGSSLPPLEHGNVPLFLVVRSRKHPERWVFPKGGIEHGETSEAAGKCSLLSIRSDLYS